MKGVFNSRPALPRYNAMWDVGIVLKYLAKMNTQSLLPLSCKVSMLFLLLSAQRCQTLHLICVEDITLSADKVVIEVPHLLKTTRPGHRQDPLVFESYKDNKNICIVQCMREYVSRTEKLRTTKKLLISTIKPYGAASKQTVSRWIKLSMQKAGVHDCFKPHSTRAASSSMANQRGVSLDTIAKSAGWTGARTFAKYYNKPLYIKADTMPKAIQSCLK